MRVFSYVYLTINGKISHNLRANILLLFGFILLGLVNIISDIKRFIPLILRHIVRLIHLERLISRIEKN